MKPKWVVVGLLWAIFFISEFYRSQISGMEDSLATEKRWGTAFYTVMMWLSAICLLAGGFLSDRFGSRRVLIGSVFTASIAALLGLIPSIRSEPGFLLPATVGVSVATAFTTVALFNLVGELLDVKYRALACGILVSAIPMAPVIRSLVFSGLMPIPTNASSQASYEFALQMFAGVVAAAGLLVSFFSVLLLPRRQAIERLGANQNEGSLVPYFRWGGAVAFCFLAYFGLRIGNTEYGGWRLLVTIPWLDHHEILGMVKWSAALAVLGCVVLGAIVHYAGQRWNGAIIAVWFAAAAISAWCIPLSSSYTVFALGYCSFAFFFTGLAGPLWAFLVGLAPRGWRGLTVGMFACLSIFAAYFVRHFYIPPEHPDGSPILLQITSYGLAFGSAAALGLQILTLSRKAKSGALVEA